MPDDALSPVPEPDHSHPTHVAIDGAMVGIALILAGGLVVLACLGREIPDVLVLAFGQIVAFYFGRRSTA